ncbi:hypothetical protein [Bacteroides sp. 14(A)]|uniref:hypothetical protein n=1 Tax=Bacteroides sp. 14(A) TaxID=1163670 RepID=UPI000493E7CA|nr:hypothetical protein [Bacteroides sp. 14(A)]
MITSKTQAAIAVLNDIYAGGDIIHADACQLTEQDMDILLSKLLSAGLIKLSDKGGSRDIQVYSPARDSSDVSLLDILEATGEHLDCNHPTTEEFHMRYGKAAQKLGIVNYITREYLKEIKLFEL